MVVRSTHWGRGQIGPGLVAFHSSWGAFRSGPDPLPAADVTTLPLPAAFDGTAPAPAPRGLVGLNRSAMQGDGTEFAVRPPVPARRSTAADPLAGFPAHRSPPCLGDSHRPRHRGDHRPRRRQRCRPQRRHRRRREQPRSLGRAAGAIAEHFMRRGDRVGLRTFATAITSRVRAANGRDTFAGCSSSWRGSMSVRPACGVLPRHLSDFAGAGSS